jgi:MarR family transcriptional regulator, 2-MHQ and catechol-resistance regulon repressor
MPKRYGGTDSEKLQIDAYVKMMRCADTVQSLLARNIESYGITLSQLGVMEILLHHGEQNQKSLAGKMLRSGANLTTIIDNLEKRTLVRRNRGSADRRVVVIDLTPAGKKLIADVFPRHLNNIFRMMSVLSADELRLYAELSRKLGLGARQKMTL